MVKEMTALKLNETQDLAQAPSSKEDVGCEWVYIMKLNSDGSLAHLKTKAVAKGYL